MTVVENKILNVSDLFKKTDYNSKILDIEAKYFSTSDFNQFMGQIRDVKIKKIGLVNRSTVAGFRDKAHLNKKVVILKTKAELKSDQNKMIKLKAFGSCYFHGIIVSKDDGTQNDLVFKPVYYYFKKMLIAIIFQ